MRAVVQRVFSASVRRQAAEMSTDPGNSIKEGLLVFLGIHRDDLESDLEWMVRKILSIRLFSSDDGTGWKLSVKDANLEILCISQFTLYGKTKGAKPDFHDSMAGSESLPMYEKFLLRMGALYNPGKIQKGFFGERMEITSRMDGPVTMTLDSPMKNRASTDAVTPAKDIPE